MKTRKEFILLISEENRSKMLEGKGSIKDSNIPIEMQLQAMSFASEALGLYDVVGYRNITAHIKKGFDKKYGTGWLCVVGSSFGCYFTHTTETFINFYLGSLSFLIFRGASA